MQWSVGGVIIRHCHIVLLHAAAAAVLLCLLLPGKSSQPLNIHESVSVHFGRDRGLKSDTAVPDVPTGPQVWLYSLIGTDFPGALYCAAVNCCKACAPTVVCQILSAGHTMRCATTVAVRRCRRCSAAAALAAALHRPRVPAGTNAARGSREKQRCAPYEANAVAAEWLYHHHHQQHQPAPLNSP